MKLPNVVHRHLVPAVLAIVGLAGLVLALHLYNSDQVGINPVEFVLKMFGKIFYCGIAWVLTHVVIKYFFPTVYLYAHFTGGIKDGTSQFRTDWRDNPHDPRLRHAIIVHVGVFLAVSLLLALAF